MYKRQALENPILTIREKLTLICTAAVGDAPAGREFARFMTLVLKMCIRDRWIHSALNKKGVEDMNNFKVMMNGIIKENPTFVLLLGMCPTLEHISTNIVASPIPVPVMAEEVVPSVGHIPSRSTNVGFSLIIPFIITLKLDVYKRQKYRRTR